MDEVRTVKSVMELRMGSVGSSLRFIAALALVLGVAVPAFPRARAVPHSRKPAEVQSDLDAGKQLFETSCASCHGFDAGGGQGPNIQRVPANRGDDAVVKIIKGGVPGTGMPAFGSFTDAQAMQIVAYIRSLASAAIGESGKAVQAQTGDAEKGKSVYASSGCANCHLIHGVGGDRGPELSEIGSLRSADYFRKALQDPGANLPKGAPTGPTTGRWIQYLMFQATTKDGQAVEGMRVSESSIAIVLEDSKGNLHSFLKWDLKSLEKEPGKSFMPSFSGSPSNTDTDDLVAYLVSLKGAK